VPLTEVCRLKKHWRCLREDKCECHCHQTLYTDEMRGIFLKLMRLTDEQRGLILCWFCPDCARYVGPGDECHCCG